MAQAPGPGKYVGRMTWCFTEPALIRANVQALTIPVVGTGGRDSNGYELHFRYTAARERLDLNSPDAINPLVVEFDAQGEIELPWPGLLELTGGDGQWSWAVEKAWPLPARRMTPRKYLTRWVAAGSVIFIPANHTWIGSYQAGGAVAVTPEGTNIALSATPQPIASGVQLTMPADTLYFTAWGGALT